MCDFCKNVDTGDDYNPLIETEIDLGFAGKVLVDLIMLKNHGNPTLSLQSCMNALNKDQEDSIRVNFCPICGRKLAKGE